MQEEDARQCPVQVRKGFRAVTSSFSSGMASLPPSAASLRAPVHPMEVPAEEAHVRTGISDRPTANATPAAGILRRHFARTYDSLLRVFFGVRRHRKQHLARQQRGPQHLEFVLTRGKRQEERRVGKECRSRWSPYH